MSMKQSTFEAYFAIYNARFFGGEINSMIHCVLEDLSDTEAAGYFDPDHDVAGIIGICSTLDDATILAVLLHEMIHAWDWARRGKTNHGVIFRNKAREISLKVGFKVPV